ncbi:MAG TPA: sialidase family protein, partial [Candidatus Thermoplasmatota archaeon]
MTQLVVSLLVGMGFVLSGCLEANAPEPPVSDVEPGSPWVPDCTIVSAGEPDCLAFFNGERPEDQQTEVSLTTHPTDSSKVLISWRDTAQAGVRAAVTHDGGKTWVSSVLRDPTASTAPGVSLISFDPTSVFLQDGTPAVLYAGENPYYERSVAGQDVAYIGGDRFTFAWSPDGGSHWEYSIVW